MKSKSNIVTPGQGARERFTLLVGTHSIMTSLRSNAPNQVVTPAMVYDIGTLTSPYERGARPPTSFFTFHGGWRPLQDAKSALAAKATEIEESMRVARREKDAFDRELKAAKEETARFRGMVESRDDLDDNLKV